MITQRGRSADPNNPDRPAGERGHIGLVKSDCPVRVGLHKLAVGLPGQVQARVTGQSLQGAACDKKLANTWLKLPARPITPLAGVQSERRCCGTGTELAETRSR